MPQVPYSPVPTVDPAMNATPTVHPNIGSDAFGASQGAAMQQFGGALTQAGNQIFTRALALKELDEQAAVDNAMTPVYEAVSNRMVEFRSKSGLEAKNDHPVFIKDVESIIDKGAEGLSSPYARDLYMRNMRHMKQVTIQSAGAHAGVEFKNYLIGTEQARVDNATRLVTMHPEDDEAYKRGIESINSTTIDKFKGWGPEERQSYIEKQKSDLAYERALSLNRSDFKKAKEFVDEAVKNGELSGEKAAVIADRIRTRQNEVVSRVEAAKILDGEGLYFGAGTVSNDRLKQAIGEIESSNNYNSFPAEFRHKGGKLDGQLDRPLGRYGILRSNLPRWLAGVGENPNMTEREFVANHAVQDKVFDKYFMEGHKNANDAADAWLGPGKKDTLGTTHADYQRKLNKALAKTASRGELDAVADKHTETLGLKDDPEFKFVIRERTNTFHSNDRKAEQEAEFNNKHTVESALGPDPNGKLPTSPEEINDPAFHTAWEALPDYEKTRINKIFAKNAEKDYEATPENQAQFRSWLSKLTDRMASPAEKSAAMDMDFMSLPMPMIQRQKLNQLKKQMFKNQQGNPKLEHAMSVLGPQLYNAGVTKKADEEGFNQFRGTLHEILDQQLQVTGTYPKDQEIIDIGTRLLRETVISEGMVWNTTGPAFKQEVPEAEVEKIRKIYLQKNLGEPTPETIQKLYAVKVYNNLYNKKKEPVK